MAMATVYLLHQTKQGFCPVILMFAYIFFFDKLQKSPLGCIATEDISGEYRTYLAFMPAPLLGQIYREYGQRLLERNVRAFLQAKNAVNSGIQRTLKDEPERFLAYNMVCVVRRRVSTWRSGKMALG